MLAPPPDRAVSDKEALSEKGKDKYLKSLEKKLGKLEGTNKKKLTSKDVLTSLSEAREDHMRQLTSNTKPTSTSSSQSTTHNLSTDVYDPWRPHNTSTTTAFNTSQIELEDDDVLEGHIEITQQHYPTNWKWLCCTCCSNQRVRYSRAAQKSSGVERPLTSLTPEEERAFLLDCDELGLTWEKDGENR